MTKKCKTCKYYTGECEHPSNKGIEIINRIEYPMYSQKAEDIKNCKNYEEA